MFLFILFFYARHLQCDQELDQADIEAESLLSSSGCCRNGDAICYLIIRLNADPLLQMLRELFHGFLWLSFIQLASTFDVGYTRCNCETDGFWSVENIHQFQKISDFLIATAYFSIPLELLYFLVRSNVFPFKWILFQFGAFIVLCGLTHLLDVFSYEPHSFHLMLALTVSKFLTALVSFATAVTLLTLIPQLLRIKVRENLLWMKASELNHEVSMMKRQEATSLHVRMLTQEIRKSLDRHTILYTTLVTLSNTLRLKNCVIWMPDKEERRMHLTHELGRSMVDFSGVSIPVDDPDVMEIKESLGCVKVLNQNSVIGSMSGGDRDKSGAAAAVRVPMLKVSNFKGGTPEFIHTCYAVLVLVLPGNDSRKWSPEELELIEVVADQVAVALSHAAVLEESQMTRDELAERNRALLRAKEEAVMASKVRNIFQRVMGRGMRRPVHSILSLLTLMQQEKLDLEQRLVIDTMAKTSGVVSALIDDVTELSNSNHERVLIEMKEFFLHTMIKEAVTAARTLCNCRGFDFVFQVGDGFPNLVVGDERRIFHVLLHMVDSLLNVSNEGCMVFQVHGVSEMEKIEYNTMGRLSTSEMYRLVKFEIGTRRRSSENHAISSSKMLSCGSHADDSETGLNFSLCKKLVQMMHGSIWAVPNNRGQAESMVMLLQFPFHDPAKPSLDLQRPSSGGSSLPQFPGLRVLLVDEDDITRAVTRKLLERLGCLVAMVSTASQCSNSLAASMPSPFQLVVVDLDMPSMDGFEMTSRIRKLSNSSSILIICLTVRAKEDVWGRCLLSGINGLMQKPVGLRAAGDELRRVLQGIR